MSFFQCDIDADREQREAILEELREINVGLAILMKLKVHGRYEGSHDWDKDVRAYHERVRGRIDTLRRSWQKEHP